MHTLTSWFQGALYRFLAELAWAALLVRLFGETASTSVQPSPVFRHCALRSISLGASGNAASCCQCWSMHFALDHRAALDRPKPRFFYILSNIPIPNLPQLSSCSQATSSSTPLLLRIPLVDIMFE
jgi:hypothetical protein